MKVKQMVPDTSDVRECVTSIPLEIGGGMLPSQIVNLSRDLRWSKNFLKSISESLYRISSIMQNKLNLNRF